MNAVKEFRRMLSNEEVIVAPGVYDCVSAKIAEQLSFPAVYMGGWVTNSSIYGKPDVGFITLTEMVWHARNITSSVNVPVLADADTGYGNPLNVIRTVQEYEKAGVAGIHIEDQAFPKKCGNMPGRHVIPREEMIAKIKAAVDARKNDDFVIVVRSDAYIDYGINEIIERGVAFAEAGADAYFPILYTSPNVKEDLKKIRAAIDIPLMLTLTHYGTVAYISVQEYVELGCRLLVSPFSAQACAAYALKQFLLELKEKGSFKAYADKMISFDEFTRILGLPEINALEEKYGICSKQK